MLTAGVSGVVGGQAGRATGNLLDGRSVAAGLLNPGDIAIDGTLGVLSYGACRGGQWAWNQMRPAPGPYIPRPIGQYPEGRTILRLDPNGKYVIFEQNGTNKMQFDVNAAEPATTGPLGPPPGTPRTAATIGSDGKIYVLEGMHRLEGAQAGGTITPQDGGIPALPGWLEYNYWGTLPEGTVPGPLDW